ncbi:MAG: methyltransferase domain-containing protein [Treponema sp.]|jgi:2-polyprenyl-3-methyl-5-hydroxy-6-metoxy-1,4-benzoquinol methylase/spore coat polysaccharide biosynthesis predicted glycosyltransferase SpsG|nr:methyltransferase domain-containing protein [Treponema sp.]
MLNRILIVPAYEPGRGGGHLVRCTKLVNELQTLGKKVFLYDNQKKLPDEKCDLIILDRFRTSYDELKQWKQLAPVIGIDEGGTCRDNFDFLIDILPNLEKIKPNINDIGLLPLPKNNPVQKRRDTGDTKKKIKILISFGMEDNAGLGHKVFNTLNKNKNKNDYEITLLNKENLIPNLAEHLHEFDLIFTHFGITAFEAVYAGTPVILINPTKYHKKLSKKAGFTTLNKPPNSLSLRKLSTNKFKKIDSKSLAELIAGFLPHINRLCPVCEAVQPPRSLARFPDRTYRRCIKCGIIFMDRLTPAPIEYKKEYFFENYIKQYGKTYLEDFPSLKTTAKRRLKIIKKITGKNPGRLPPQKTSPSLLDMGCAYGAFLDAAKEEGFSPFGIDPCKEAVEYLTKNLGIQAIHSFFPDTHLYTSLKNLRDGQDTFSAITLWFTIEHFRDCIPAFALIRKMLSPGGILAFSTPSFSGISGQKKLREFLKNSPADHFTIWSPKTCKKALSLAGFKVAKIVNCGHHPKRFPILGQIAKTKKNPLYWPLLAISRLFNMGDTFEVYAVLS